MHKIEQIKNEIQSLLTISILEEEEEWWIIQKQIAKLKYQLRILKQETFN